MGNPVEPGKAKAAGIVGILCLIFGFALFIVGCIWISYGGGDGTGLWSGLGILVAGILGIVTWVKQSKGALIFMLVLSILEIILLAVQCVLALIAWLIWQLVIGWVENSCKTINNNCVCTGHSLPMGVEECDWVFAVEAIFLTVTILSALGAIIAFAASIIGCMGTCCASNETTNTTVIVQQPAGMVPQNAVVVSHGGQVSYGQAVPMQQYPQQGGPPAYSQEPQTYQTKPSQSIDAPGAVPNYDNAYPMADHS